MSPQRQDDYLDAGYFRAGHTVRQTRFLFLDRRLWSTIWSRVPLAAYALSKRQRKLVRRVEARFSVSIQPYRPSEEQDVLYHAYQLAHPLDVATSLPDVLGQHAPTHTFHTHTLHVRHGERLVAFSCFDRGPDSLASIFGCYHPDYARDSLGTYTMLGELAHGRSLGLAYYHPGYCVPGVPAFDYKLRLPMLEGKTYVSGGWHPMPEVLAEPLPHERIEQLIQHASHQLRRAGVPHRVAQMPLCEMMDEIAQGYGPMPHPLMIALTDANPLGEVYIGYDLPAGLYELWYGQPVGNLRFEPAFDGLVEQVDPEANLQFFEWRTCIYRTPDAGKLPIVTRGRALLAQILGNLPFWNGPEHDDDDDDDAS